MTRTSWNKIVSGKELKISKNLRSKTYITLKERTLALPDLIDEGWTRFKSYKNPKFIGVKKDKPYDELFEDRVWLLFANLGFTHMNCDRDFKMSYDFQNPDFTQQIDVFAVDDDTIIIVECKAAESMKDGIFKKPIEALHGQMDGLRKEAQKQYQGRKVKFIWATHNYIMSKSDLSKLEEWGIIHFNDAVINYYIELSKHLGSSARYQLLGNLFANQEIRNMEETIPAIQGKMGGFTYYCFVIEPERLLKISYVLHRNEANKNMMPTYQRLIKKKRLSEVRTFINNKNYFPNSLIISIDTNCKGLRFDLSDMRVDGSLSKLGILHLPKRYRSAYIIDGQHRLYGYSDSDYGSTNSIPVVAFVDLDRKEQIKLFMDINENQKAVPKTLRVTLNADMLWDSDDFNERRQALRSKIAQMLGEEETSPLLGRVVVGENERSFTKSITVEAIQGALKKCQFFTQFTKNNTVVKDGTFDVGQNQKTCDIFYPFIEECLRYIKKYTEVEWENGDSNDGIVTINRGIQAIIRVINDVVNYLVDTKVISPKISNTEDICKEVNYYLDPLIEYLNNVTSDQKKDLRGYLGGGADVRFWRTFQKTISDVRNDFNPEGLKKYWMDEAKTYNEESMNYLRDIQIAIKSSIAEQLEKVRGENWIITGIPKNVYSRAKNEADTHNYDIIASGMNDKTISIWECVTLSECREIVIHGRNWNEIFEGNFTRPEETKIAGGKKAKTEWIYRLSSINSKLSKATYSVSTDEYEFIKSIGKWLSI
ncbi:DGQHR domain-containing protein [Clostridium polynesiense]|uniref:DGQHR domain-containing protein n=1 Tax=Clostridium polynesiense TaxID=1325933 RepID=UPI00058E53F6|nr:DGQHR domain-containing protein [Clostridium polynesiense]